MVTSIRRLCDRWGWSNSKVIKFLKTLENDSIIHVKSDTKKTVITIVNYSVYQGFVDKQATQKRHQNDAEATHKKKVKNNNKYNNNSNSTCGFVDKIWMPLYTKAYRDFFLVDNL